MTTTLTVNPKRIPEPGTFIWSVCNLHGSWYGGEVECPECFRIKQLPWWKRIFV